MDAEGLGDGFRWWNGAEGCGVSGFSAGRLRVGLGLFPGEGRGLALCAAQFLAECMDLGPQGIGLGPQCRHRCRQGCHLRREVLEVSLQSPVFSRQSAAPGTGLPACHMGIIGRRVECLQPVVEPRRKSIDIVTGPGN